MTGCPSIHEGFFTIEDVRAYMNRNGVTEPKEVIKDGAGETTPLWGMRPSMLLRTVNDLIFIRSGSMSSQR